MLKQILVSTAVVVLLASPLVAKEVVVNGGFDDNLESWNIITEGGYQDAEWYVVNDVDLAGNQVAYTPWDYQIRQDVEPVKVSDIEEFSLEAKLSKTTNVAIVVTYVPEYPASKYSDYVYVILSPEDIEWGTYDILPQLDPTKTLESVKLSGYSSNSDTGCWFDNITIQTRDVEVMSMGVIDNTVEMAFLQGFNEGQASCEIPEPIIQTIEVEKVVQVAVTGNVCDGIDYSSMTTKDSRQIKKYCGHMNKWQKRVEKVIAGYGDNNGHQGKDKNKGKTCDTRLAKR